VANTYAVYNSGKVKLEYWCGDIYAKELLLHQIKQRDDIRVELVTFEIIDFRDANFHLSNKNVVEVSDHITIKQVSKHVAMIVNKCDWEQANLYSRQAWNVEVDVIAFHTVEAACAWIQLDSKNIVNKLKQLKTGLMAELVSE
jgi:hypothetical protein